MILEGIHYRYTLGQTVGAGFDRIGDLVPVFIEHGLTTLQEGLITAMDFAFDARTEELRARLLAFMDEHVHPAEAGRRTSSARGWRARGTPRRSWRS